jgi:hypothetical protein
VSAARAAGWRARMTLLAPSISVLTVFALVMGWILLAIS